MNLAFVCTGNTCRSPMAEYFLKELLRKKGLEQAYRVTSFGLGAFAGDSPSCNSVMAMNEIDIDITPHRSRTANPETLEQDLFLTMGTAHRDILRRYLPDKLIFTLKELNNLDTEEWKNILNFDQNEKTLTYPVNETLNIDIADPYGGSLEEYRKTRDEIVETIESLLERIEDIRTLLEE